MTSNEPPAGGQDSKPVIQANLVISAASGADIPIAFETLENGDLDYLYHREHILVRDAYLDQVANLVGGEAVDGLIDGVTVWALPEPAERPVADAIDLIDERLGVGVATPNHVMSICPVAICPATEPEVPPPGAGPDPGICPGHGGDGVLIEVVDTGLLADAHTHSWLSGVTGDPDPFQPPDIPPYTGHGTFVAGIARCMAPRSQVHVAQVLHHAGAHLESEIIRQLDRALSHGPDIISLSAGGKSRKDVPPLGFEALWQRYRHHKGVLLVAAAGNDGERRPFWPAAFPHVLSVGSLSANWRSRASFSGFGGWVDVYAPGEGLVNAYATGTYRCQEPPNVGQVREFHGMARWSGTSFSTPLVAGLIAARMSRTGHSSTLAAQALLAEARAQALPGVGPVLYPCDSGGAGDCPECRAHGHGRHGGDHHGGGGHWGGHHGGHHGCCAPGRHCGGH